MIRNTIRERCRGTSSQSRFQKVSWILGYSARDGETEDWRRGQEQQEPGVCVSSRGGSPGIVNPTGDGLVEEGLRVRCVEGEWWRPGGVPVDEESPHKEPEPVF